MRNEKKGGEDGVWDGGSVKSLEVFCPFVF